MIPNKVVSIFKKKKIFVCFSFGHIGDRPSLNSIAIARLVAQKVAEEKFAGGTPIIIAQWEIALALTYHGISANHVVHPKEKGDCTEYDVANAAAHYLFGRETSGVFAFGHRDHMLRCVRSLVLAGVHEVTPIADPLAIYNADADQLWVCAGFFFRCREFFAAPRYLFQRIKRFLSQKFGST